MQWHWSGVYCHSKPCSLWCVNDVPWVVFCCQTQQIYFSCSWEPLCTQVELREGKVPLRNYRTQCWEWTPGRARNAKNTINELNASHWHPHQAAWQGWNCAILSQRSSTWKQENSGNCCSPDPFQALWASKYTWATWPRGWVFVTRGEGPEFGGFCAKMSLTLEWGAQSHLQTPPALFPLPWQCLGRAQRANAPGNYWSFTRKEAFNSCLIITC